MANITITITRDNGINISGSATVDDALLVDITSVLGSLIFDASAAPIPTTPPNS